MQPRRASQTRTQQTRRQQQSLASKRARDFKQAESEDAQPKPDEVAKEQPGRKRRRRLSRGQQKSRVPKRSRARVMAGSHDSDDAVANKQARATDKQTSPSQRPGSKKRKVR